MKKSKKYILLAAGWFFVLLGLIGAFLPILPTTPFLILAAYFFSKSSKKLHHWLLTRPKVGPLIKEWELHGIIGRKAKIYCTASIVLIFSSTLYFSNINNWLKLLLVVIATSILSFIWTRPESSSLNKEKIMTD